MTSSDEKVAVDMLESAAGGAAGSGMGTDSEKAVATASGPGDKAAAAIPDFGFSPAEQRRIIRRVDRRLVLTVGAMYCVSLMDRTNLGAANIAGMSHDLRLVGNQYVSVLPFFLLSLYFPSSLSVA